MRDDDLKSLLQSAEVGWEVPALAEGELVRQVLRLEEKRRKRTRMLASGAPLVLLGAAVLGWTLWPGSADPTNRGTAAVVDLDTVKRLQAEADYRELVADERTALVERERNQQRARKIIALGNPLEDIRAQIDVVAYRMILRADALDARQMASPEAIELYRKVVRLFPDTYSAEVAQARLVALRAREGEA